MDKRSRLADRIEFNWRQVKRNGREFSVCRSVAFFAALALGHYGLAVAAPTGGKITGGSGVISQQGARTDIRQDSQRLDIDWNTFSTTRDESVNFRQPDQLSVAINRVIGGVPSHLQGALNANGRVFILNSSGIVFHRSATVNVGALLATTARDVNVDGGRYTFSGGGDGEVINEGDISISDGGFAVLVAPDVTNTGYIQADLGTVALVSGDGFSLDLRGDGLIKFKVDGESVGTVVNTGVVRSRSGRIEISVADAQDAVAGVINLDGVVDATALAGHDAGVVLVKGGDVDVTGDVRADGATGGEISILGDEIELKGATISASGPAGGGSIQVGGEYQGKGDTYTADNTLVDVGTRIRADATDNGDGGYVIVWSDGTTTVHGEITARGGAAGGDGGFIETSGKQQLVFSRAADASAPNGAPGTWLLDPENIDIGRGEADAIEDSLNLGNNVSVKTGSEGEGEGNISVNASITKSEGDDAALAMDAHGSIDVNAPIKSTSGKLDVKMKAGKSVNVNSSIDTNGGNVSSKITGVEEPAEQDSTESVEIVDESGESETPAGATEGESQVAEGGGTDADAPDGEPPEVAAETEGSDSESEEAAEAVAQAEVEADQQPGIEAIEEIQSELDDGAAVAAGETGPEPELEPSFDLTGTGSIKTGGGDINIEAIGGIANVDGVLDASNPAEDGVGGEVTVFADEVNVGGDARIDVSGDAGGGTVLIGGDVQGGGDAPTATKTTIAEGAEIRADARSDGDGGTVVVWSDGRTEFGGDISARGGEHGGDGGFVEVSGKEQLSYRGMVDTRAPEGETGVLLLDPTEIFIANGPNPSSVAGNSATSAVDEGTSGASSVTIYEKDLEAQLTGVLLVANRGITLQDLADDELTMTVDLELRVRGSSNGSSNTGFIVFEDLGTGSASASGGLNDATADTIRVTNEDADLVLTGGTDGSSNFDATTANQVTVTVGNLVAVTPGVDDADPPAEKASANVTVRSGGDIQVENVRAEAIGEQDSSSGFAGAAVDLRSGGNVTVNGDIEVSAEQTLEDDDDPKDFRDWQVATAYLDVDAGTHSSGAIHIKGDIDVTATAAFRADVEGTASDNTYAAEGYAGVYLLAADDITLDGEIRVIADADASGYTDVYGAKAHAYLFADAGVEHEGSDGNLALGGDVLVSADASHQTFGPESTRFYLGGAEARASVALKAADDITIGERGDVDSASDEPVNITVASRAYSDMNMLDLPGSPAGEDNDASAHAVSYLTVAAGLHSSGALDILGDINVSADAELHDAGSHFNYLQPYLSYLGGDDDADAFSTVNLFGASALRYEGDITVDAVALSSGENNDDAYAAAYLHAQVGGEDPFDLGSHGSSNADLYLTGSVRVNADATYKGDNNGNADAWAEFEMDATGEIVIETGEGEDGIQVTATALASGTGDIYTGEDSLDDRWMYMMGEYLADDAKAYAGINIDAGWHGSGSVDITGDLLATADATLLNGSYEYLERSGYLGYLGGGTYEGAEAYAIVDVDIRAAGNVDIVGDLVVNAKSLSSGEHNSDAEVQANLYLEAGREPYSMYLGEDSHSSAAINITGNIDVNVDGDYRGWGLGSADVEANVYMEAAGDIVIDGDVTLIADADASSVSQVFVVAGEDGQSPEAVDIDNYLPDFRYEYLGVDDADANIDFYAFAGTHSGGTFDMKGDFNATATATLNGGYLGCAFMSSVECVTANDNEADIDVRIYSVGDVKYEGDITLLASATASGEMPNEAVTDVYLDIRAGIYGEDHDNSSAQITVTGDIIASGNASWSGGSYLPYLDGSADTFVSVYLAAAGDITIDGDLTLNAIGTADAREYAGHAEDAEANAYLTINAGTHSGGTADIEGDINVTARATAYDAIHGEEVYAQNTAEAGVYIDAVSDVNIVGDITVTGIVDVNDGGEGYAVAYLSLDAGDSDHEDNSEASLTVTGDILVSASADRTLDTDDEYIGNETVAYAWVDFDASRDITVNGDLEINATARGSNTGEDGSGAPVEVWADAYLSVDAGEKNNRGDFALNGDLAMTASATKLLADEHDSYDGGQADADVYVYIQAADDVDMENIYLASRALSDGTADNPFGGEGEASAWTYLHIEAGDDIDITGDIEGYANAEYYGGEGAASADATINTYLEAGDSIAIDGDIVLVSRAISSGDDSDGPDGGEGHTDLTIIAGESSDGYLEIRGDVYVAALAYGARTEGRDVTADAHVEMFAAGDLSIDGDVTVYAGADAENSNSAWADAELYLQAGAHGSDGSLDIEGDIYVMADAYYYADADNEEAYGAYANATVDFNAADDIRIRGDVNAYAWAFATGFGEDSSSVGDASARTYLSIEAGTHSSGAIDMEGDLSAYASAYLRDGTYLADAVSRVELTAANNIRVAGDIHVEADAATYGGGFEYFGGIYLGSDAYIGSTFVGNEYLPVNALAYLTVGAGDAFDNSHDDNSNASILIDGDVNVEAANEFFGEYGFMYLGGADHYLLGVGVLGFGAGGVYGGAMTYTELQAAEDIVIDGDLRTDAHAFTVGGYDAKAINLTLGYAGSHSDGDFTVTGSIDMGADAYMYGFGTPIGEDMFPLAVAAGNFVAAEDFVVGDDIRLSTYAYGSANEGAGAVSYLNVYGAAHGEDSSQVGGIFVGGDVHVEANAFHDSEEAVAWSIINMEAADSHEGYDNDIVIVGETRAEAFAYGGSSADGYAFASIYLAAGDDIFASPVAIAASSASAGTSVTARCDAGGTVSIPGGEVCVDSYADPDRLHNAYLFVRYHGVFDDEVPETPKPDEVVGTPGGGGTPPAVPPGVTPPAPTPPLEVIQRTVESWLAAIWGYPEYVEGLPPGIAEGFTVDPTGKVTFTQSFGDYFKGAYDSGICNYMNCPPSVEDAFGQAAGELQDTDTTADPDLVREGAPGNLEREVGDAGTTTTGRSS